MAEMIDFKSKLSGDIYVNEWLSSKAPENWSYGIGLFANHITLSSPNPVEVSSLVLSQLSVTDSSYGGVLSPDNITEDDWNKIDDNQSLNFGTLKKYIKFCLENSGQSVPYLTYVFSDHVIYNDSWVSAGSTIDLTAYPDLSVELFERGLASRLRTSTTDEELDKWVYKFNNNQLTLPTSDRYIKATSNPDELSNFIPA